MKLKVEREIHFDFISAAFIIFLFTYEMPSRESVVLGPASLAKPLSGEVLQPGEGW